MSDATTQLTMDEEAVAHARRTKLAGDLSWAHLEAEYTQDPETIADSLATGVPLQWCLARPDEAGARLLTEVTDALRLSARGYHRVLRVARTLADMEGAETVGRIHIAEAASYRRVHFGG